MSAATELWAISFDEALARLGRGKGAAGTATEARRSFLASLPPGYAEETSPEDAAGDWLEMSSLLGLASGGGAPEGGGLVSGMTVTGGPAGAGEPIAARPDGEWSLSQYLRAGVLPDETGRLVPCPCRPGAPGDFRLRRVGLKRVELSSFLPVLESFGLAAVEAVPWHFELGQPWGAAYVDDIGLRVDTPLMGPGPVDLLHAGPRLVEALEAVLRGQGEVSSLNRLVLGAGLNWRQVDLLCAYAAYRRLVGGPWAAESAGAMTDGLVGFPATAAAAVDLFAALLVPGADVPPGEARSAMTRALAAVPDREPDQALHELVSLVEATTRSSWGLEAETIALKFSSYDVPLLPSPRPMAETFVWSPSFEALHVRFGPVARGGIRWSDRQSDLRGEVLSLARAQVKKNSLIVPTGAKGAFVLRKETGAGQGQGKAAYCAFISALLDVTDNIVGGEVVHPKGITCRDGDDPYLVVAPDKGTAHFSDLANSISEERGFWLGDAFASGGSHGYDHKALGITARGAWVAVRRHFRALGMDAQSEPLRVVGVGDMSGDVFGNSMLQSRSTRLMAAFDHRHIFVDPSPDPERSYDERLRLSRLEHSSWADYDLTLASPGAAVYSRHAKQVELSPQASGALDVGPGPLSPPELVKAVLGAHVDLVFFGGIGTFVKAPGEADRDVDDRTDDDVRVGADQLRARVVAEGANLAVTQRARVSYSRRGGRVNADFVDNAAGVAMSDREVNLKILLGSAIEAGRLSEAERDDVLVSSADAVASSVLGEVGRSIVALDRAAAPSALDLSAYEALMRDLGNAGLLDPEVEALPDDEELARRKQAEAGLSRPELAVLFAYARSEVARSVEASPLVSDDALRPCAVDYFPPGPRQSFADLVPSYPLYRQLVSSELANDVVDRMGAVWAHEVAAETGRQLWEVAAAYWAARQVLGTGALFAEVDAVAWSIPPEAESALRDRLSSASGTLARWYLAPGRALGPGEAIAADRPFAAALEEVDAPAGGPAHEAAVAELAALGAPEDLAGRAERIARAAIVGEMADVARAAQRELGSVIRAYAVVEAGLALGTVHGALRRRETSDRWERWQLDLLADDLARTRADAVTRALQSYPGVDGDEAAERWLTARSGRLGNASFLVNQLSGGSPPQLPLLALAVRALGEAVRA